LPSSSYQLLPDRPFGAIVLARLLQGNEAFFPLLLKGITTKIDWAIFTSPLCNAIERFRDSGAYGFRVPNKASAFSPFLPFPVFLSNLFPFRFPRVKKMTSST
jgi:hypothetical protein